MIEIVTIDYNEDHTLIPCGLELLSVYLCFSISIMDMVIKWAKMWKFLSLDLKPDLPIQGYSHYGINSLSDPLSS
jgi:hypothetical protein